MLKNIGRKWRHRKQGRVALKEAALADQGSAYRFATIGAITVAWAKLEGSLDIINDYAFANGGKAFQDELPQSTSRKLRFMRRCHKELPQLAPLRDRVECLIDRVFQLMQRRHDIIHGIADEFPKDDLMHFVRFDYSATGMGMTELAITTSLKAELVRGQIHLFPTK